MRRALVLLACASLLAASPALAAGGGIEIMPSPGRLIPLIVLFLLMVVPVNRLIIQPLLSVIDERESRIAGAQVRASQVGKRADDILQAYETRVAGARESAEDERRGALDEARHRQAQRVAEERGAAETRIEEARREIDGALEQARGELRSQAEGLARQAAERMLGRSL